MKRKILEIINRMPNFIQNPVQWYEIKKCKYDPFEYCAPSAVGIEITNICNSNCVFCPRDKLTRKKEIMSNELFFKIIDICKKEGIASVSFGGFGEPLCDKDIITKARYVVDSGLTMDAITTNASLLTSELSYALTRLGLRRLIVSIDSLDRKRYESLRRGLGFDEVFLNLIGFIQNCDTQVLINAVRLGRDEIEWYRDTFMRYDNVSVTFSPYHNWGNMYKTKGVRVACERLFGECVIIRVDGSLSLCPIDYDNVCSQGIIGDSLMELWNSQTMKTLRFLHVTGQWDDILVCRNCSCNLLGQPGMVKVRSAESI